MNYRHSFHVGNHADILKHVVLCRVIDYLKRKPKSFRVVDTHAGRGLYDLHSAEAVRSPEWRDGIGRLYQAQLSDAAEALLVDYRAALRTLNPGPLSAYPGSPRLIRMLLRPQDRLSASELHPQDHAALADEFRGDVATRILHLDGWLVLKGHLPPKERRGVVLVDPSFEVAGEFDRLAEHFITAHRKWPTGTFLLWYPVKAGAPVTQFHRTLVSSEVPRLLVTELVVKDPSQTSGLAGSGLVIANPPFTLEGELGLLLPELTSVLGQSEEAEHRTYWLRGE